MAAFKRTSVVLLALTSLSGIAAGVGPVASAAAPPSMNINASGGDNTTINSSGTQGKSRSSVEGTIDTDGDQDAFDFTSSEEAKPQEKAPNKMTKS